LISGNRTLVNLETVLANYFVANRPTLDDVYRWNIPDDVPFGSFNRGTDSSAQANARLKRFLAEVWKKEPAQRMDIATWYVSVWGGIRANKIGTIERYVCLSEEQLAASDLQGVATWSKILTVRNPNYYPIYDARVAASLNALQLVSAIKEPILFPQVPSRNSKIAHFHKLISRRFPEAIRVPRSRAYEDYVSLVGAVARKSGLASPDEVEMILFANAEKLVIKFLNLETNDEPL
jgi:hypothetical protein